MSSICEFSHSAASGSSLKILPFSPIASTTSLGCISTCSTSGQALWRTPAIARATARPTMRSRRWARTMSS